MPLLQPECERDEQHPNRNLSSSDGFQTMGLLVAEEVMLDEDRDWDLHNAETLDKLLHALHMHEMWTTTSRVYNHLPDNPPINPNICSCLADEDNAKIYFNPFSPDQRSVTILMIFKAVATRASRPAAA